MNNAFEIRGDDTAIFLCRRDGSVLETVISTSDLKLVDSIQGSWVAQWDKSLQGFYVICNITNEYGKHSTKCLHTFIMDTPKGKQVDHKNHNTLDNRRNNLRVVTNAENSQNRNGAYSNNKTGFRGVTFHEQSRKWRARATINYKCHWLGWHDTKESAIKAVVNFRKHNMKYSEEDKRYA